MTVTEPKVYFNGINGSCGQYVQSPLSPRQLVEIFSDVEEPAEKMVRWGVNKDDLASAGWGVIFAPNADADFKKALSPLLELRRDQAGPLYRELEYLPGQDAYGFLHENGAGPSLIDPKRVPYYLLIVGGPDEVPFDFQFELDVQYAVGRLGFDPLEGSTSPEASYASYAQTVKDWEEKKRSRTIRATLFGVCNEDDSPTEISMEHLVGQLKEDLRDGIKNDPGLRRCRLKSIEGSEANKSALSAILKEAPSLLFTAGHALLYSKDDPCLLEDQGGLICSDWPGPEKWKKRLPNEYFFSARDVVEQHSVAGMIAFLFGCFTAGTPEFDSFSMKKRKEQKRRCNRPFLSRLPQRLLDHPRGGVLAVIGHVDLTWWHSFLWKEIGRQTQAFEMVLKGLLAGQRVGAAMQAFDHFHLVLADRLLRAKLKRESVEKSIAEVREAFLWTAYHDARSYMVLGDPAVRLRP